MRIKTVGCTRSDPADISLMLQSEGICLLSLMFPNCLGHTDMDAAHHRHWPGVLKVIAGCHISLFQMPLPEDTVQLGGSMSLHGNHMTLACFHGPNFRSKSWALFHLEEPNIAFWTEAQKIWEDGETNCSFQGHERRSKKFLLLVSSYCHQELSTYLNMFIVFHP